MREANFTTIFVGIETPRAASLEETHKMQNLRGSILDSVHRIQRAGIEVMAGMIVGFDHDDTSIFEEQFRFIQEARIPISMTGLLNAIPLTPLYERLKKAGRLIAESVGDQFVLTNVIPQGMSREQLYEGYRSLLQRLYGYRNYRRRVMQLILARGTRIRGRVMSSGQDLRIFARVLWTCVLRASPRRAWLTLSLMAETALRRPAVPAPGRHARAHAQAPLRIHARRLRAARRARGRAQAGEGAGNFGSRDRAGLTASFGFGSTVQVHPLTRR